MTESLSGKVAAITGAASGIGAAAAERFAQQGARLVLADVSSLEGTLERVRARRVQAVAVQGDLRDAAVCERIVATAQAEFGSLDVLVNNAGIGHVGNLTGTTAADLDRLYAVNVRGVFNGCKVFLPGMLERGRGSIVNMASVAGSVTGVPNRCAYGASKAAVIGLTKSVAADFVDKGIRCNAICPGTVDTPSLQQRLRDTGNYEEARRAFVARRASS